MGNRVQTALARFTDLCSKRGLEPKTLGSNEWGDILYVVINPEADLRVCFMSVLHGDEGGGLHSILRFLEKSDIPDDVGVVLIPVWNLEGLEKNKRRAGRKDPNRQWCREKLDAIQHKLIKLVSTCKFLHTLHEDPDRDDFYLYFDNEKKRHVFKTLIDLTSEILPITKQKTIYKDPVDNGMIYSPNEKRGKHDCSLEMFFIRRGISGLTTETPGTADLELRAEAGRMSMEWLLQNIRKILD
jgi:predicted deacylase